MAEDILSIPDVPKKQIGISGTASSPAPGSEPSISPAKSNAGSHPTAGTDSTESPAPNVGDHIQQITSITMVKTKHDYTAQPATPTNQALTAETDSKEQNGIRSEFRRVPDKNAPINEDFSNAPNHEYYFRVKASREGNSKYLRLALPRADFETIYGRKLEPSVLYQIEGEIHGIGKFRFGYLCERRCPRPFIHVPPEYLGRIRIGETYNVRIDSITVKRSEEVGLTYHGWCEVGGYFDGDGSIDFKVGKWIIFPRLTFTDNYHPHLAMLKRFLMSRHVETESIAHTGISGFRFGIGSFDGVHRTVTMILNHTVKKREELKAVLDYLENKITGSEFAEVFNESVRKGNRTGKIRFANVPYLRNQGLAMRKKEVVEWARSMGERSRVFSKQETEEIKRLYLAGNVTEQELANEYGVALSTISRTLFGRHEHR